MNKKLSILICSLYRRNQFLERLKSIIEPQILPEIEVLASIDNGEKTIGQKRNELLEKATGEYIAFVDDDDVVSDNYIELVLKAIETKPDVVGIHLLHKEDGILKGLTYHSLKYKEWWNEPNKYFINLTNYYRNPNHLNPVKRELALATKFPSISMGEDREYSKNLLKLLKTEVYIDDPIYTYEVRTNKEV